MRIGVCTALFITLVASPVLAQAARPIQTNTGMEPGLQSADKAWARVYSAKDLSKSVAACDDHVSLLFPNTPVLTGKKAAEKAIRDDFSTGNLTWRPTAVGVARSGDLGYTSGLYELKSLAGAAIDNGKYLTIWKKEPDGRWRVLFDTFNSDRPLTGH